MYSLVSLISTLFDTSKWPPRWYCGEWSSFHGWVYIISDIAIWAAYAIIPFIILFFMSKRNNFPFKNVLYLFILFILTCGATHLADAIIFYIPFYNFNALLLALCAIISWVTIVAMIRILPEALKLKAPVEYEELIAQRTTDLQAAGKKLKRQNKQLLSFAHITSHDLRGHVSTIQSIVKMNDMAIDNEEQESLMKLLIKETDNLMLSINEMNEVVKLNDEEGLRWETLEFEKIKSDIISGLGVYINEDIIIETNFSELTSINYPYVYLKSVIYNILINAIKYKHDQRQCVIKLKTYLKKGVQYLTVSDNGLGIDMNKYGNKIFQKNKMFHGDKSNRGVGLFMIKNQIESLGGEISVESELNIGTTFTVKFNSNRIEDDHSHH